MIIFTLFILFCFFPILLVSYACVDKSGFSREGKITAGNIHNQISKFLLTYVGFKGNILLQYFFKKLCRLDLQNFTN